MVCVRLDIMKGLDNTAVLHGDLRWNLHNIQRQTRPDSRWWAGFPQCAVWHTRQRIQGDRPSAVYLFLFLSPQAHLSERLKEVCDGHPYMLWTSHEHHGEDGTLWKFTKHAMLFCWLRSYGVAAPLTHRPAFDLRVGRRLRDEELQSLCLRLGHDLKAPLFCWLAQRGGCANILHQHHCARD